MTSGRAVLALAGSNGTGVWGYSPNHVGVRGRTDTGTAVLAEAFGPGNALFVQGTTLLAGEVVVSGRLVSGIDIPETGTPSAPIAVRARVFARDNGSGKTQLCVRFGTGDPVVLATEP
jgi:hypothetical protein